MKKYYYSKIRKPNKTDARYREENCFVCHTFSQDQSRQPPCELFIEAYNIRHAALVFCGNLPEQTRVINITEDQINSNATKEILIYWEKS